MCLVWDWSGWLLPTLAGGLAGTSSDDASATKSEE